MFIFTTRYIDQEDINSEIESVFPSDVYETTVFNIISYLLGINMSTVWHLYYCKRNRVACRVDVDWQAFPFGKLFQKPHGL